MADIPEFMFRLTYTFFVATSLGRLEGSGTPDCIHTLLNYVYRSLWSNCSMLRTLMVIELDMASVQQLLQWPDELEARRYPDIIGRCAFSFCLYKATV